jgi:membrane protein required for colicin V production
MALFMSISTIIDIAVILIILVSAGVSFFRGFVREVLTIIGFIGGGVAAFIGGPKIIPVLDKWFGVTEGKDPGKLFDIIPYNIVADICAYAGIFLAVFLVLQLISYFMSASVKAIGLGPVDRSLGVVFGIARALLFLGVLYWPFHGLISDEQKKEVLGKSKTFVYVEAVSNWIQGFVPSSDDKKVEKTGEETRDKLKDLEILSRGKAGDIQELVKQKAQDAASNLKDKAGDAKAGYSDKAREGLNKLIETETAPAPESPGDQTLPPQGQDKNDQSHQ